MSKYRNPDWTGEISIANPFFSSEPIPSLRYPEPGIEFGSELYGSGNFC